VFSAIIITIILLFNGTGEHLWRYGVKLQFRVSERERDLPQLVVGGLLQFVALAARPLFAVRIVGRFGRIRNRIISRKVVRYLKATRKA